MDIRFCFWMAKKLIWGNKERGVIPLLGIAVGIALVFTILAIGEGGRNSIEGDLFLLGENRVLIGPNNTNRAKAFDRMDVRSIERIPGIEYAHLVENRVIATTSRTNSIEITGYDLKAAAKIKLDIVGGNGFPLRWDEILLEERVARDEYGTTDVIGEKMEIHVGSIRKEYRIKGIYRDTLGGMRELGGAILESFQLEEIIGRIKSREMIVTFNAEGNEDELYPMILFILNRAHGGRNLYRVFESNDSYRRVKKVMRIVNISLGAIGAVALFLGGAGVANMMLLSIKDRIPHIGILRATGASQLVVGRIFILECFIFTVFGGFLGISGGLIVSQVVGILIKVPPKYSIWQVLITIFVAIIMGAVSGYYPAKKASDLEPIEAIRKSF